MRLTIPLDTDQVHAIARALLAETLNAGPSPLDKEACQEALSKIIFHAAGAGCPITEEMNLVTEREYAKFHRSTRTHRMPPSRRTGPGGRAV